MKKQSFLFLIIVSMSIFASGCVTDEKLRNMNEEQSMTIESLNSEISRLNAELDEMLYAREDLEKTKSALERKLQEELQSGDMSVAMQDRGLVVTVQNRVLFDSGKANLKTTSQQSLAKIVGTLKEKVGENMIFVEGHTDNEPIQRSGWRSNWELSTARATEVIHYFVEQGRFNPVRLAATGYGEFQPVANNGTEAGRMKNRRVEIIISPRKIAPAGLA